MGNQQMKRVDNLYVDMTFFKPEIPYIPTREESVKALLKFIRTFLGLDESGSNAARRQDGKTRFKNFIYLKTSARIGYEYVFQEINRATGFKIHVNDLIFKIYEQLPVIQSILTQDAKSTPIHACIYENRKRDQAKTDLMESSLNSRKAMKKSYLNGMECLDEPMLPCELVASTECDSIKTPQGIQSAKVILSAMWFTGLDILFYLS